VPILSQEILYDESIHPLFKRYNRATDSQRKCEYGDYPNKGQAGGYSLSNFLPRKEIGILKRVATKKRV
jgi:hypothetical protein